MRKLFVAGAAATLCLTLAACTSPSVSSKAEGAGSGAASSGALSSGAHASATPTAAGADSAQSSPEPAGAIDGSAWTFGPVEESAPDDPNRTLVFHDFRIGEHDGFTRVVVEFAGTGTSGYRVLYGETPLHQGKGDPIDIKGTAFLDVIALNTTMPVGTPYDDQYYAGDPTKSSGFVTVAQDGTFEANTHLAIGLDQAREFQVGMLTNPTRLVIDIKK